MLRVRLLGELQADVDGAPVAPPASRRAWSLLAWLALHPGTHARGVVAARFWPDVLDTSARASLRSALWELRRALGTDEPLVAGRERIALRAETDLAEFEAHVAAGRLEDAVALHRGPLLAGLDEDWVLEARDELSERVGSAYSRLAAEAATPAAAVAWARRRLQLDPLDEDAARELMRRLAEAGDRAGALATYDRLSERLREALGLAPSQQTRTLAATLRQVEAPATARADGPPLVGRDSELQELAALLQRVEGGVGAVAVIGGEGGIGKTRLAAELLARARAGNARAARCGAVAGAPPFAPWVELLAALARELEPPPADSRWPEELGRIAPSLPRRLGRAHGRPADVPGDLARARLYEAAVELAEYATADRPLVLMFDDVHVADAPTLELAAYLARRIVAMPVLLVLTRRLTPRRDEVDALVHTARARGVQVREHELRPLNRVQLVALIDAVSALDAPTRERVILAADGNPLLALESARAAGAGDHGPPASLRGVVRTAIAGLVPPARRVTELAAVAGRPLDRLEVAALADPEDVIAAMDCGLFRSIDGRVGFRHDLLREAVAADLDDARRDQHHETLGRALRASPAEAARHLRLAGRDDLAAERLVEAAAAAVRATASVAAVTFLREAVELRPDDDQIRIELATVLAQLARREEALEEYDRLALATPEAHHQAALWFRGPLCDPGRARTAATRGLARASEPWLRAELLLIKAWAEVTIDGSTAGEATLAELSALGLDLEGSPLPRHHLRTVEAFALTGEGRLPEAEAAFVASGEAAEAAGRPDLAYSGWANAACVAVALGDTERAVSLADRGAVSTSPFPVLALQTTSLRAGVLGLLGRYEEAREASDHQSELAARLGSPVLVALADHDAGLLAAMSGDHDRAQELLARALTGDPPIVRADARLRRAESLARCNRPDDADAEIRAAALEPIRAAQRPDVLVARMAFAQALVARVRGDAGLAARRLGEAERHWRRLAGDDSFGRQHLDSLVDLGRPPVTGIVMPSRELERVAEELRGLEALADVQ